MALRLVSAPDQAQPFHNLGVIGEPAMNRNESNDKADSLRRSESSLGEFQPVDNSELTAIVGGVGPVFDTSKVEGYQHPSWYLPRPNLPGISPR